MRDESTSTLHQTVVGRTGASPNHATALARRGWSLNHATAVAASTADPKPIAPVVLTTRS